MLILPSRLSPLAKDVMGTLVINPGALTKGISGGTFAELAIHPVEEKQISESSNKQSVNHDVCKRSCVNIIRI